VPSSVPGNKRQPGATTTPAREKREDHHHRPLQLFDGKGSFVKTPETKKIQAGTKTESKNRTGRWDDATGKTKCGTYVRWRQSNYEPEESSPEKEERRKKGGRN